MRIGNNKLRGELIDSLENVKYRMPTLICLAANVSKTAKIGRGTAIEPQAIVNANTVLETWRHENVYTS